MSTATNLTELAAVVTTRYGPMRILVNDNPIGASLRRYGEWAFEEIEFLRKLVRSGDVVLDVGANIGTHSVALSSSVGAGGHVYAYEPQELIYSLLCENIERLQLLNITCENVALGATAGITSYRAADPSRPANHGGVSMEDEAGTETATMLTIDGLLLSRCDLIKIDAEGMGEAVVDGAMNTIRRCRPVIFAEANCLDECAFIFRDARLERYEFFLVQSPAFNPENYSNNGENFFGVATETSLVCIPQERGGPPSPSIRQKLTKIADLDDLAVSILTAPRYGDETATARDPVQERQLRLQAEARLSEALRREEQVRVEAAATEADFRRRLLEANNIESQLKTRVLKVETTLNNLRKSRSWRITQPLRHLGGFVRMLHKRRRS